MIEFKIGEIAILKTYRGKYVFLIEKLKMIGGVKYYGSIYYNMVDAKKKQNRVCRTAYHGSELLKRTRLSEMRL